MGEVSTIAYPTVTTEGMLELRWWSERIDEERGDIRCEAHGPNDAYLERIKNGAKPSIKDGENG